MEILNKMTVQNCDIYEAKKILGINRGKSYVTITKEKRILGKTGKRKRKQIQQE